jgi:Fe2+ or Zn2+ uptake regulation protein
MTSVDQLCAQLKASGRRVTPQRRAIIRVLLEDHAHVTAEQVLKRVRTVMPDLSPATVYNTLHELVEMDVLQELLLGVRGRHYEIRKGGHAHLVCLGCGRIEDVPQECDALMPSPEDTHGFQVLTCNVVFRGYCPACASRVEGQGEDPSHHTKQKGEKGANG